MSDTPSSSDNSSSMILEVELQYGAALAALQAFDKEVEKVEGRGANMADLTAAMKGQVTQLRDLQASLNTSALELSKLAEGFGKARAGAEALDDEGGVLDSKAKKRAQDQIRDGEYLNKTLEQRLLILQRIAVATQGVSDTSKLDQVMQRLLSRRFSPMALQDYNLNQGSLGLGALQKQLLDQQTAVQAAMDGQVRAYRKAAVSAADQLDQIIAPRPTNRQLSQQLADQLAEELGVGTNQLQMLDSHVSRFREHAVKAQNVVEDIGSARPKNTRLANELSEDLANQLGVGSNQLRMLDSHVSLYRKAAVDAANQLDQIVAPRLSKRQASQALSDDLANELGVGSNQLQVLDAHIRAFQIEAARLDRVMQEAINGRKTSASIGKAISNDLMKELGVGSALGATVETPAVVQASPAKLAAAERTAALELERVKAKQTYAAYEELKGAARGGLAGTGGPLWLTYGAMVPMAASAALGGLATASVTQGAKFEENMAYVKELSRDTQPSLAKLNDQIKDISGSLLDMASNSRFSAVQLSESMRQIAQAGYNPQQAQQILPAANNLAVVGETTPDKAATSISGQIAAFGMSADDAARIANVTALAASKSPAGVQDMMEAMKQASSVAKDYGASLEETAAIVSLLAQRNITGSMAGTAFRNMLEDLAGRSKKGSEALKELGVELYDHTTQKARATKDVLNDLIGALSKLNQHQQNYYLQQITTDRGRKAFSAVLAAGPDGLENRVNELQGAQDNGGFAAFTAQRLDKDTLAQYHQAVNALTSSLIEGFDSSSDSVKSFLQEMRDGFRSNEFKDFVHDLTGGLASLTHLLIEIAPYAEGALKIFTAYSAAKFAASALTLLNSGLATNITWLNLMPAAHAKAIASEAALTAEMAASASAATAQRLAFAEGVALLTGPWGLAIAAATAAWLLFGDSAEDAARKANRKLGTVDMSQFASDHSQAYIDLKKQADDYYGSLVEHSQKAAKSEADVLENVRSGESAINALRAKMGVERQASNASLAQAMLDEENKLYQGLLDQAMKYYDGSAKSKEDLAKLESEFIKERVRLENEGFDLMVARSAQASQDMIQHAREATSVWAELAGGLKGMGKGMLSGNGDPRGGSLFDLLDYGKVSSGWNKGVEGARNDEVVKQLTNTLHELSDAYLQGKAIDRSKLASDFGLYQQAKAAGFLSKETIATADSVFAGARRNQDGATADALHTRFTALQPQKLNSTAPPDPNKPKADHTENSAAQEALKIAKENTTEYQAQLKIQQQLGLGVRDAQQDHLLELQIAQESAQYKTQELAITHTIKDATDRKNASAKAAAQQNLVDLAAEHKFKLDTLKLQHDTDEVVRKIGERQKLINTDLSTQQTIIQAMLDGRQVGDGFTARTLAQSLSQTLALKAQVDLSTQLRDLAAIGADKVTLELAGEQAKLNLAQQLYDVRKKEFELRTSMTSGDGNFGQQFGDALGYKSNELAKQNPSWTRGAADGFVSGTDSGFKQFFAYMKDPAAYQKANGGKAWSPGEMISGITSSMYDSMTSALSTQMTKMVTDGLQQALGDSLGLKFGDPMKQAQDQANSYLSQQLAQQQQANGYLSQILQQLGINQPATLAGPMGESAGGPRVQMNYPQAPSYFDQFKSDKGYSSQELTKASEEANGVVTTTKNGMESLQSSFTGAFGMMAMGLASSLASGKMSIKDFVKEALIQFAVLYSMKMLLGWAAGANGAGAAPAAAAHAEGGLILGPGTGTSDSIPARLSNGEFVLKADAVKHYGVNFLDALNHRQVAHFAEGGVVGGSQPRSGAMAIGTNSGVVWNGDVKVDVHVDGNGQSTSQTSGESATAMGKLLAGSIRKTVLDMAYSGELNKAMQVGERR